MNPHPLDTTSNMPDQFGNIFSMSGWVGAWIIYENRSDTIELATHWRPLPPPSKSSNNPDQRPPI